MKTDRELLIEALDYIDRITRAVENFDPAMKNTERPAARRKFHDLTQETESFANKIRARWGTEKIMHEVGVDNWKWDD